MRLLLIALGSAVMTFAAIANAFVQKSQFYPAVVYITKSNPSMAVLYIQAFVVVMLLGKMMRKVFFGQLRAAEMEHLMERSWYAVTETCLAFTVFRDDFSPKFVSLFTLLLFLKGFHWLAEDRIDYMERSPIITFKFHIRACALLLFLGSCDATLIHHAFRSTVQNGATVQLVFGFEYAILLTMVVTTIMKYALHTIDLNRANPWENKTVYLLYTELVTGFIKALLYVIFVIIMIKIHTFPLFAIRPMYLTLRAFKKSVSDVVLSRRAIAYMNNFYPDATEEELSQLDNVCIICRDEMSSGKKLPCGHIFHAHCLRSWFQRQQSCPTCRMDVLRPAEQQQQQQQRRQAAQAQPPQPPPPQGFPPNVPGFNGMHQFGLWNIPMQPGPFNQPPPAPPQSQASTSTTPTTTTQPSTTTPGSVPSSTQEQPSTIPRVPPPFMFPPPPAPPFMNAPPFTTAPPFVPPPPFMSPPPPYMPGGMPIFPPQLFMNGSENLRKLSDEELRKMEGQERANIEARLKVLRNVHALLDSAIVQLNQYSQVVTTLNLLSKTSKPSSVDPKASEEEPRSETDGMNELLTEQAKEEIIAGKANEEEDSNELRRRRLERFSQNVENIEAGSRADS